MTHAWHDAYRHPSTPAHHLDPRGKLLIGLTFVGCVLFTTHISRDRAIAYVALLILGGISARLSWRDIGTRFMTLLPFVGLMAVSAFLSALPREHLRQALIKSTLSIGVMALVTLTTPFPDFLRALEEVRLPKILVLFMAFVYRYLAVLGDEVVRMEKGWSARYFGRRWLLQWRRLGDVVAALLIRSYERAERVYAAMLARGFAEESSLVHVLHFSWLDLVFVAIALTGSDWYSLGHHMTTPLLSIRHLSYHYPDGTQALTDINLDVLPGERVAVMGPNGAGKSTLFYHLNGTLRGEGEIQVEEDILTDASLYRIRRKIGLLFQDPNDQLFMPTVFEDVAFGPMNLGASETEVRDKVLNALRVVDMEKTQALAPHHLSLGQRKKVALAAVLALNPSVLVFDEPSSGLDPRSRRHLIEFLKTLPQTQLIATHDLDLVLDLCQRAVIIDGGRIVYEGSVPGIFEREDVLHEHGLERPLRYH